MSDRTTEFDFDGWKLLAESDAEAFEQRRRELLQAEIDLAPASLRPRLRGLQWQIDMMRQRCKTPAMASARLFEMMWDQVYGDNGFLDVLTNPRAQVDIPAEPEPANVLPFRAQKSGN
jgi:hypothetical protein